MSDKTNKELIQYIDKHQHIINQIPGYLTISGLNSRLMFVNQPAGKILGFKQPDCAVDCTYSNMPCRTSEIYEDFIKHDQLALEKQKEVKCLALCCYSGNEWKIVLGEKKPYITVITL